MWLKHRVIWGTLGLTLMTAGCEAPEEILPTTPPGAVIPRTPPDADNPAQAQGETIAVSPKASGESSTKPVPYTPATPTAKGETKTTKNGVKYETLKEGTGEELRPGKVALFHYEGKLEDGTVFDTTRTGKQPAKFAIGTGQLIKGWEEGMPGMRVGEIRKLLIPAALAYRDQQAGKIPPNSNLIFEVELIRIID
jgi:FKBP-type peptidyl-prolyl cis-trans isomerase